MKVLFGLNATTAVTFLLWIVSKSSYVQVHSFAFTNKSPSVPILVVPNQILGNQPSNHSPSPRRQSTKSKLYSKSTNTILKATTTSSSSSSSSNDGQTSTKSSSPISLNNIKHKSILVIGGSGRVGGSVVCNLLSNGAKVTVGGTNVESYNTSKQRWEQMYPEIFRANNNSENLSFLPANRESTSSISNILSQSHQQYDLIIHTAGPFQGKVNTPNGVIDAAIQHSIPYIDVCDDYCTARAIKSKYHNQAIEKNVPCIISTGCWPGVSSLMAKQLTTNILKNQQHYLKDKTIDAKDLKVDFSFFTAGSGGAGMTILLATFLILAEKSLVIQNSRRREINAMKDYTSIDFGPIVGRKDVSHLNLLEAASVHDVLGVGNVQTLFGTAPGFWNTLLGVMAQLPSSLLSNEEIMKKLALFSLPIVRIVDYFAGATNAMRVDVSYVSSDDQNDNEDEKEKIQEMALYAHENLEPCVGQCVIGFCAAILAKLESGDNLVKPGVCFPEEAIDAGDDIANLLSIASIGAHTLEVESNLGLTREDVWGVR